MAYNFKQIYNLAQVGGVENLSGSSVSDIYNRFVSVKNWVDENLSDIFETTLTSPSSNSHRINFYYKGTASGFYIQQATNGNDYGVLYGTSYTSLSNACSIANSTANLVILRSHYGIIAGIYNDNFSTIQTMALNIEGQLYGIVQVNNSIYLVNRNQSIKLDYPLKGNGCVCLSKFNLPTTDVIPNGIYLSSGLNVGGLQPYEMPDGNLYVELPSTICNYALKLAEPSANDFQNLIPLHNVEEI